MAHGHDQAIFGLGADNEATDLIPEISTAGMATDAELAAHAGATQALGIHGKLTQTLADGTASGANVTVTGMATTDTLVSVLSYTTKAAITSVADRTAEYVLGSGVLTKAAGTDETAGGVNQLVILWINKV